MKKEADITHDGQDTSIRIPVLLDPFMGPEPKTLNHRSSKQLPPPFDPFDLSNEHIYVDKPNGGVRRIPKLTRLGVPPIREKSRADGVRMFPSLSS